MFNISMLFLALKKVWMVEITSPQVSSTQYESSPPAKFPIHTGGIPSPLNTIWKILASH